MIRSTIRRCVTAAIFLVCATFTAQAQVPTGTINGRVTDPGNAVVNGAKVSASNDATAVVRETVTNGDGLYVLADLAVGIVHGNDPGERIRGERIQERGVAAGSRNDCGRRAEGGVGGNQRDCGRRDGLAGTDAIDDSGPGDVHNDTEHPAERPKFSGARVSGAGQPAGSEFRSDEDEYA